MTEVRKADPTARRNAVVVLVAGICVGALLIAAFERYRIPFGDWVAGRSGGSPKQLLVVFLLLVLILLAPLLGCAACFWSLGSRVIRAREYPPPGLRVIRDTAILTGESAVSRGGMLRVLAGTIAIACTALGFLLCRLAFSIVDRAN